MGFSRTLVRLDLGLLPLALTPALFFLMAEGYVNLGGGCKDVTLVLPWLLWSAVYCIIFFTATRRGQSLVRGAAYGAGGATALMILVFTGLYFYAAGGLGLISS